MRRWLVSFVLLSSSIATGAANRIASAAPDTTHGQARVVIDQQPGLAPTIRGYQSQGGTFTVSHTGASQWTVHLGGLTAGGGNVQLTQYLDTGVGSGNRSYCSIGSWFPDATGQVVLVNCWADNGSAATAFAVGVLFNNSTTYPKYLYAGFWQGSGTFSGTVTPPAAYVMVYTPRLTHTSIGHYTVEYLGPWSTPPFPLVTAWGATPAVCNVVDWSTGPSTISPHESSLFVRIACFDFSGLPLDTGFSYLMSNHSPLGVDGRTGGSVLTNSTIGTSVTPSSNNINNTTGVDLASNSFLSTIGPGGGSTTISVPGYGGAVVVDGADTLESVGDDGTRCYLENPPIQSAGVARLLDICWDPRGNSIVHRLLGGTWHLI